MIMETLIDIVLLGFLVLTALAVAKMQDLFAVVMLSGIYSLISASLFMDLDAVDVAFTEASVGAGISTLLMLASLKLVGRYEKHSRYRPMLALGVVLATGTLLIYGTLDMPHFGSAEAPVHQHVAPRYLNDSMAEIGVPNVVTSVLASYRGYDTLGETLVVFTAGIGVISLLRVSRRTKEEEKRRVPADMQQQIILRVVAKMMLPLILIFALYVQFHGDYGPGGGFQAGVIFAAGIILYTMLFGLEQCIKGFQAAYPGTVQRAGGAALCRGWCSLHADGWKFSGVRGTRARPGTRSAPGHSAGGTRGWYHRCLGDDNHLFQIHLAHGQAQI